ncbi:TPA: hypothetical protein L7568_001564 [Klebsiella pneumoniae]|uniref:hypothetical protein n=1 Tax=Klebsiella sp. GB_Kp061 TaxID=3153409 RepID=UPI002994C087|nr:hypothetical protein [Klebsiella pneumoniae]HBQ5355784.1 hypothetical protein [Klebsiella pneumoniae]HBQ5406208.1 hypothetical protein [Klebsiella pneumoniae]HBQ5410105.1 hypothetical protein [Klebsiella pneumoniae]HBQ5610564.1 hypothetical protein [Klebsiella pneumoniae]
MTDITELTSVQKNANIHRLSRLIAYASNDELRQMAVEVEHYTDQLIEALEKAQTENTAGAAGMAESYETTISMLRSRIAELESRSVTVGNLQESAYRAGLTAGWNLGLANNNDGFNKCLAAHTAGFKVKAA